jgi:hypothetical protein
MWSVCEIYILTQANMIPIHRDTTPYVLLIIYHYILCHIQYCFQLCIFFNRSSKQDTLFKNTNV